MRICCAPEFPSVLVSTIRPTIILIFGPSIRERPDSFEPIASFRERIAPRRHSNFGSPGGKTPDRCLWRFCRLRCVRACVARMIRLIPMWLATEPLNMRAGSYTVLTRVVQVFGAARQHHGYTSVESPLQSHQNPGARRVSQDTKEKSPAWCGGSV